MRTHDPIGEFAQWFPPSKSIVVPTAAGMSAKSGIPTFCDAHVAALRA
jgi:NAD-dependent SIR2 family protein deacetylase